MRTARRRLGGDISAPHHARLADGRPRSFSVLPLPSRDAAGTPCHRPSAGANPRTPEKWPRACRPYLRIAAATHVGSNGCSKDQEIGQRSPREPPDRFGEQRRRRQYSTLSRTPGASRNAGTASVTTSRSMAGSARTSSAPGMNRPWVTIAITRRAPAVRAARAARKSVPPVLIRSSITNAVAPATSPTNRSPETTPALRCFRRTPCLPPPERLPAPREIVPRAWRRPGPANTTQISPPSTFATYRRITACAVSVTVRQRKAFSNATGLCTSRVTMHRSQPPRTGSAT